MSIRNSIQRFVSKAGEALVHTGVRFGGSPYYIPQIRQYFESMQDRHRMYFDAASQTRLRADWSTDNGTPYSNMSADLKKLINRSRLSTDNQALSEAIDNVFLSNVVHTGIKPEPVVKDDDGELMEDANAILRDGWERVNDQWDRTGYGTYYEAQKLQLRTIINSGSVLVNTVPSRRGSYLPVSWELMEPDRLDWSRDTFHGTSKWTDTPKAKQTQYGIDLDKYGVPERYWVEGIDTPFDAKNMDIRFVRRRPAQFIGVPWKAPVLTGLWDLDNLVEDKTIQSRIQSLIGFWFSKNDARTLIKGVDSNKRIVMEPGKHIYTEQEPKIIEPKGNLAETFDPLIRLIQRTIALGTGLSYQVATKDLQGMNFASSRANILEDRRIFRMMQLWLIKSALQRDYERYVYWMFASGKLAPLTVMDYNRDSWRWTQAFWQPPGWDWVDPLKDAKAAIELNKAKMLTLKEHYGSRGKNWRAELRQLAEEQKYIEEIEATYGVQLDNPVSVPQTPQTEDEQDLGERIRQHLEEALEDRGV